MKMLENFNLIDEDYILTRYQNILKKHNLKDGVDFSGLSEKIMLALEQGNVEQVHSIIDKFVEDKIKRYDIVAGERDMKRGTTKQHREAVNDLIGFSKKYNSMCTEAILKNVKVEPKQAPSFRENVLNFQSGDREPANNVSNEEALRRNAQRLYEKTGQVPQGYVLQEDGQVDREENEDKKLQPRNPEKNVGIEK